MLDIRWIRENVEECKNAMKARNCDIDVDELLALDETRRSLMSKVEVMKAERNKVSSEIPKYKKEGKDVKPIMTEMRKLGDDIKSLDDEIRVADEKQRDTLMNMPNIPASDVPVGADESANVEVKKWGEPTKFNFEPKPHWDIGTDLDILDFETAAKITGARFTVYKSLGARLERAITQYFLNSHLQNGYEEIGVPFIVNSASLYGTGQLPKFKDDQFKLENTDYYLIATSEIPLTNMYRDEILTKEELPKRHCAYSACFRAEAGSAGRDTRGLIRQHQFNKVELVKISEPDKSYAELEHMLESAEGVLQGLNLPYRVVVLSTGDAGISAAKTYDIEVWMPSYNRYVEISSCSNCTDYQARRANIKFRAQHGAKPELAHTLNGSGVAVGRTTAAILENFQQADGSVKIPEALVPYMLGVDKIG